MRFSYYTIDDLRLGHDPRGVTGWRLSQFLDQRDALEHYRSLSGAKVKEFGLSNGMQVLQLVRCLPLFPGDQAGHDVLLTDGIVQPLWRAEPLAMEAARTAAARLDIRYCLDHDWIVPAPEPQAEHLEGIRLPDGGAAVRRVRVAGEGWLTTEELERRYASVIQDYRYPLVLMYLVDALTGDGQPKTQEVTPWAYRRLERRAKQSVCQNKI